MLHKYVQPLHANSILFQLGKEIAIGEGSQIELRLGLVQTPVALNGTNGGKMFLIYASASMAISAIEMTKLGVNGNLVVLQLGSYFIVKYEVD